MRKACLPVRAEPEWPSGTVPCLLHVARTVMGLIPKPPPMLAHMDQNGLDAMLTSIQSAGVTPDVNLRITQARKHAKRDLPWLWNPGQMSLEVQNKGISGPTKRTYVLQKKCLHVHRHAHSTREGNVFCHACLCTGEEMGCPHLASAKGLLPCSPGPGRECCTSLQLPLWLLHLISTLPYLNPPFTHLTQVKGSWLSPQTMREGRKKVSVTKEAHPCSISSPGYVHFRMMSTVTGGIATETLWISSQCQREVCLIETAMF